MCPGPRWSGFRMASWNRTVLSGVRMKEGEVAAKKFMLDWTVVYKGKIFFCVWAVWTCFAVRGPDWGVGISDGRVHSKSTHGIVRCSSVSGVRTFTVFELDEGRN